MNRFILGDYLRGDYTVPVLFLQPGTRFDRYEIVGLLGSGGMGVVYRAIDTRLHRPVAIKILSGDLLAQQELTRRLAHEARVLSALSHPNICTLYDIADANGQPALIMELLEGETLAEWLSRGPVPLPDVVNIGIQVASALGAAHQKGILHRDIKPGNICILPSGRVKVLDFGLAKSIGVPELQETQSLSSSPITAPGTIVGTMLYAAPEQTLGECLDARTDIFSFGVVLYQCSTGILPFTGKTMAALFDALLHTRPIPVRERNPNMSTALADIIDRALERQPEDRQQSAEEIERALLDIQRAVPDRKRSFPKTWSTLLGMTAAIMALAAAVHVGRLPKSESLGVVVSQATDSLGEELFPSMAPDGKTFVFTSREGGNWDIYSQRLGGQRAVNLTADFPGDDMQPSFSPEGDRIAFRSDREGGGTFIMGATGESVRKLADFGYNPSWSPDGKRLVVATEGVSDPGNRGRTSQLWTLETDTGDKHLIYAEDAVQPSWSPHGERIAFWSSLSGRREVKTISASGGEAKLAANDGDVNWNPVWSQDGRFLYYLSNKGGSMNVWRVGINERTGAITRSAQPVTTPATDAAHLSLARSAPRGLYVQRFSAANLHKIRFDGQRTLGESLPITRGTRMLVTPDVSADSEWVVYGTFASQEDIYVIRTDGTAMRQLTNDTYKDRRPRWSPDGRRILFDSNRSGRNELWQIGFDGGSLTQITRTTELPTMQGVWSPNGKELAFSRPGSVPGILQLSSSVVISLDRLASHESWAGVNSWSPDGALLAFHSVTNFQGPRGIGIYPVKDGQVVQLRDVGAAPSWLADSRRLLYETGAELHLLDTVSHVDRIIMRTAPYELELGTRAGGVRDWIYYSLISRQADIWSFELH